MVTVICDKCDRRLELPESARGTKVECPHCGDVNVVPAGGAEAGRAGVPAAAKEGAAAKGGAGAKRDRPGEMGLPPDRGPEQRVMRVRPAMLRARPGLFLLLATAVVGGVTAAIVFAVRNQPTYSGLAGFVGVLGVIGLLVWKVRTLAVSLEITNKRTVETRGLLSRATSEVLHDDIRNLQITQTFWQRVWGVGEIAIASAGHAGVEIHTKDLPRPMEIRRVIDAYRDTLG